MRKRVGIGWSGRIAEVPSRVLCIPRLNVAAAERSRRLEWGPIFFDFELGTGLRKVLGRLSPGCGSNEIGGLSRVLDCFLDSQESLFYARGQSAAVTQRGLQLGNAIAGQTDPGRG